MRVRKRKGAEEHLANHPQYVILEPAFASLTSMAVFGEAMGLLKGCGVILVLAAAVIGILTLNREDSKTRSKA